MKKLIIFSILIAKLVFAQELQIKANKFSADEKAGISSFEGDVSVVKGDDELYASSVVIYTDEKHKPSKYIASGDVKFNIQTKNGSIYKGKAQQVIYLPLKKEYRFFKNVHLEQVNEKKEIIGDQVVLKTIEGKAYAIGAKTEPVIMIFKLPKEEK